MAVANFIDRAATAASQVLANFQLSAFERKLGAQVIGLVFDDMAVRSAEGNVSLDLTIRLLARLYPTLALWPVGPAARVRAKELRALAKAINPVISFARTSNRMTFCIGVGASELQVDCPSIFIGSDGWRAKLSDRSPLGSGDSPNPFGAGAAACFAAANAFRTVFAGQLPGGSPDALIDLSLFTYSKNDGHVRWFDTVNIGDTHLVGLGAIGNGAVWALARAAGLTGTLHLIDHEKVDLSNLQRYVLAVQSDVGSVKVLTAAGAFSDRRLAVEPHPVKWNEYVNGRDDRLFERVAVAVDNAPDRIAIQGALPKWIVNSWTQEIDLGISRHAFGNGRACLACLYMPAGKVKDEDERVAEELRMPEAQREIRDLLQTNRPVELSFVERVAKAFNIPSAALEGFVGQPVRSFYQGAICGGHIMRLTDGAQHATAIVPMAFQSALAGIMLAAELIKHAAGCPDAPATITRMNLLRPLTPYLHDPRAKDGSGRCICGDQDFLDAYKRKYRISGFG